MISVIIPNYNHGLFLRQRIESVLSQTFHDYELIILDDGSTDCSLEIIKEYSGIHPGIITCFNQRNGGNPFIQWNKGVSMAKGAFLWIAESDDLADPHFLECAISEMQKDDGCGLVFCDSWIRDEEKRIRYRFSDKRKLHRSANRVSTLAIRDFFENPIPNVSSVLFRRDAYLGAGGADENEEFCGDWSIYLKILKNWRICYVNEPLSTFRLHKDSQYHRHFKSNKFLAEKLKNTFYIMRESGWSPGVILKSAFSLFKSAVLRFMYMINLPSALIPSVPRIPGSVEEIYE